MMIPESVSSRIVSADNPFEESVAIAVEQSRILREVADGIHIMPMGDIVTGTRILREAGIR